MEKETRFLLLGSEGFLGLNLQSELRKRNIPYSRVDISLPFIVGYQCDLANITQENITRLLYELQTCTHVVLLASKIGAKLFETEPESAAEINKKIYDNVIKLIKRASKKFNKKFHFVYYSTSEVYWTLKSPDEIIDIYKPGTMDLSNPRSLYAKVKWDVENNLKTLMETSDIFDAITILRPFNISGTYQKRGVLYDMVNSVVWKKNPVLSYSKDTTRTITSVEYANKVTVDYILTPREKPYEVFLVAEKENTFYMKTLAKMVKNYFNEYFYGEGIKLNELPQDKSIPYRQLSLPDKNIKKFKQELEEIIKGIIYGMGV